MDSKKTSLGLAENVEALFCYVLGFISGFIFLILEKDNKFVRFNAMQSFITFLLLAIVSLIGGWIPILGGLIVRVVSIISMVLWLLLMFKAYKGETFKVPVVGDIVEKQLS